jgi:hypothetical protein
MSARQNPSVARPAIREHARRPAAAEGGRQAEASAGAAARHTGYRSSATEEEGRGPPLRRRAGGSGSGESGMGAASGMTSYSRYAHFSFPCSFISFLFAFNIKKSLVKIFVLCEIIINKNFL